MQTLPRDFLTQIAHDYDLSPEQEEIFVELFSTRKTDSEIVGIFHISEQAFRSRMTGVYRKFSIGGKGPNKRRKLHDFLLLKLQEYQRSHPTPSPDVPQEDIEGLVQAVRERVKQEIEHRCGTMRVLDMTQPIGLQDIYTHTDNRWSEVFLLAVEMSPNADRLLLLIKETIDSILATNDKLQQFLLWTTEKSAPEENGYKSFICRALYFAIALYQYIDPSLILTVKNNDDNPYKSPELVCKGDLVRECWFYLEAIDRDELPEFVLSHTVFVESYFTLAFAIIEIQQESDYSFSALMDFADYINPKLWKKMQTLKETLPNPNGDKDKFKQWWITEGQAWADQLKEILIQYLNMGLDWSLSPQDILLLEIYESANSFLVEYLNSDCYVSRGVREYIQDTFLLPIAEIEKRQKPIL